MDFDQGRTDADNNIDFCLITIRKGERNRRGQVDGIDRISAVCLLGDLFENLVDWLGRNGSGNGVGETFRVFPATGLIQGFLNESSFDHPGHFAGRAETVSSDQLDIQNLRHENPPYFGYGVIDSKRHSA